MMVDWVRSDTAMATIIVLLISVGAIACTLFHSWGHEKGLRKGMEDGRRVGFRDAQQRYDEGYADGQTNYAQEHAPHRDSKGRFTR